MPFPDHPIIAATERDGQPPRRGSMYSCASCGCDICAGERYYLIDDTVFCFGCDTAALRDHTFTAEFPEDNDDP